MGTDFIKAFPVLVSTLLMTSSNWIHYVMHMKQRLPWLLSRLEEARRTVTDSSRDALNAVVSGWLAGILPGSKLSFLITTNRTAFWRSKAVSNLSNLFPRMRKVYFRKSFFFVCAYIQTTIFSWYASYTQDRLVYDLRNIFYYLWIIRYIFCDLIVWTHTYAINIHACNKLTKIV